MTTDSPPRSRPCLSWVGGALLILVLLGLGALAARRPLRDSRLTASVQALQGLATPGTATPADPVGVTRHTFPSGEWVVSLAHDSHSSLSGGSVVFLDSRGRTKVFVGHVCGAQAMTRTCIALEPGAPGAPVGLDDLTRALAQDLEELPVK